MEQGEKEKMNPTRTSLGQGRAGRILVVDDNRSIRNVLSTLLRLMGFEVALAGNGIEALAVFIESFFDLVLTDLEMPVMDGWSLTHCIKEKSPNTPVVLMTGGDRETVWKKVERGPVDSVIFKPFKLNDFQSTVQRVMEPRYGEQGSFGAGLGG
jgi:CheY-like chemotaxis protein